MSIILLSIIYVIQLVLLGHYFFSGFKYKKRANDKRIIGEELVTLINQ